MHVQTSPLGPLDEGLVRMCTHAHMHVQTSPLSPLDEGLVRMYTTTCTVPLSRTPATGW